MSGNVIAVQSVSPGVGKTVIAVNLAFELASRGARVCLVDLDETWPSAHRYLGLPQQRASVLAAMRFVEQQRLDANALEEISYRVVARGASIDFLSGYGLNLNPRAINLQSVGATLNSLSMRFDALVLDTAAGQDTPVAAAGISVARQSVLVTQPDAVTMGRFLEGQSAVPLAAATTLVINRMRSSVLGAHPERQVQQVLRDQTSFRVATVISEDPAFDSATLQGLPLRMVAPKSQALAAIAELGQRLQASSADAGMLRAG
ncbi:MAG: CpaE family protein [Micrococcales bacterium]